MTSQNGVPRMPSSKSTPAAPETAGIEENTGLDRTERQEEKLPLHEDIMQLARLGEIGPIKSLLDEGKYDANYKDAENITPLHVSLCPICRGSHTDLFCQWAAINNHYALCEYLIANGANVNAIGGESVATPAMWAAQKCRFYIVHLLLKHGADPLLTDGQGYNILHLATFDGNVFLLLILLHQNIPVDVPDPEGHTSLMWAAYKGFPAVVELLLQWGASVSVGDAKGMTALHWALVKGNAACLLKLMESGADRFSETNEGKSPATVAREMNTQLPWYRALRELGCNPDATVKQLPSPYLSFVKTRLFLDRFFFFCPFVLFLFVFSTLAGMPIFVGVPLSMFLAYSLQWTCQQLLFWAPSNMKHLDRTVSDTKHLLMVLLIYSHSRT